MSKDDADWFRIAVHNLSRPCEVDYKCGPDRKCRIHEDPQVTQLQRDVRHWREECDKLSAQAKASREWQTRFRATEATNKRLLVEIDRLNEELRRQPQAGAAMNKPLKPNPPIWRCWDPELGDEEDGEDYRAYNPEIAAEAFAQAQCSDDADCYQIYEDESREIWVKGADGEVKSFQVSGEPSFTFHARPKD